MALIDDYNQAVENPTFRMKVAVQVAKAVATAIDATTPPAAHLNLARRYYLAPGAETDRYLLPTAARLAMASVTIVNATDAQIATAVTAVLADNAELGIGVETATP